MSIRDRFSRNERNRRTLERGRASRRERVAAEVKSRTPVVRDRVNPATGRPHRDDPMMHKSRDKGLAQGKAARRKRKRSNDRAVPDEKFAREYREGLSRGLTAPRAAADAHRKLDTPAAREARQRTGRAGR